MTDRASWLAGYAAALLEFGNVRGAEDEVGAADAQARYAWDRAHPDPTKIVGVNVHSAACVDEEGSLECVCGLDDGMEAP